MSKRKMLAILAIVVVLGAIVASSSVGADEDEFVYLPLVVKAVVVGNGDFESGAAVWGQYSSNGWPLIVPSSVLLVPPHSGAWAAWMGGDDNEDAVLWQVVDVPKANAILSYWLWIASEDVCGYDVAGVAINLDEVVDGFWLCYENSTGGWVRRTIDLGAYAGQRVELDLVAFTDGSLNSNLFIDDVWLGPGMGMDGDGSAADSAAAGSWSKSKPALIAGDRAEEEVGPLESGLPALRKAFEARAEAGG